MNYLLLIASFLSFSLSAEIIETPHFRDIFQHVDKDTTVILDIDDTLLIPVQMLGCDMWFMHRFDTKKNSGLPLDVALDRSLAEWEAIRHLTDMEIVEPGTQEIVKELQQIGCPVMALTTQGLALATRTVKQLKANGIDMRRAAPSQEEYYFINQHGNLYRRGVLFTAGTPKGPSFFKLCALIGHEPKKIVFINDKDTHLKDLEKTALERGVPFIGLRYAYSDAKKAAFDKEIADYQFTHSSFDCILSDEEARLEMVK